VVRCLKQQLPDTQIHFLTKRPFKPLVIANPYIDKHLFLREKLSDTIKLLKEENYDYVIDLHHNLRSFRVKRALKARSFSFHKLNMEKWLYTNFKINRLPPGLHVVDRYLDTVKPLRVQNDGNGLDYFIPPEDEVNLEALPPTHRAGGGGQIPHQAAAGG